MFPWSERNVGGSAFKVQSGARMIHSPLVLQILYASRHKQYVKPEVGYYIECLHQFHRTQNYLSSCIRSTWLKISEGDKKKTLTSS